MYIYQVYIEIYTKKEDYKKADYYLKKYLEIVELMNDYNFIITGQLEAANLNIKLKSIDLAKSYFNKAKYLYEQNPEEVLFNTKVHYQITKYNLLKEEERYEEAKLELLILKESLIKENKKGYEKLSEYLSEINNKLGNFKEALQDQRRFNKYYIESRNKKESTLGLFLSESYKEKELVINRKKLEIENYENEKELINMQKDIIKKDNYLFFYSILIIFLFITIFVFIYYYKTTKKISEKADLVDCFNRSFFVKKVNKLMQNNKNISLTILDIDYFKNINDQYGHEIGDKILIELCNLIKSKLNENSYLCRVGGEEFLIIEEINEVSKLNIEKIRKEIENYSFINNIKLTSSFGNSIIKSKNNENFDSIYKKLDQKLYKAKNEGRNKVVY